MTHLEENVNDQIIGRLGFAWSSDRFDKVTEWVLRVCNGCANIAQGTNDYVDTVTVSICPPPDGFSLDWLNEITGQIIEFYGTNTFRLRGALPEPKAPSSPSKKRKLLSVDE